MRMAMSMLMEENKTDNIYAETENWNQQQIWANYLLGLVNSLDRLNKHIKSHKNQKNTVKQAAKYFSPSVAISVLFVSFKRHTHKGCVQSDKQT